MKSVIASITIAVLTGLADAKANFTNSAYDVQAGEPFTLTWANGVGPYQINLKDGPSTNLNNVEVLVASTTAESATITLPSTLTSGTYAFEVVDKSDSESNYSPQFAFEGAAASSTVTSASSTKASSTTASSTKSASSDSTTTASTSASTTESSSTHATTTTSSTSTRTSSSASSSSTVANTNDARGLAAPFIAPLILAAGIAAL